MNASLRKCFESLQRLPIPALLYLIESLSSKSMKSYSSYGEDTLIFGVLSRYSLEFGKELELSYVDIGGWRPVSNSNTYSFYRKGFCGTVVEPNPHFRRLWKTVRPRDNYLEVGCSSLESELLLMFHDGASSNTFDPDFAQDISNNQPFQLQKSMMVPCLTLSSIIGKHLEFSRLPFILDIDVEGRDFEVVRTHNFKEGQRPVLILIEDRIKGRESLANSAIHSYLGQHDYTLIGRTALTSVYVDLNHELSKCLNPII
jgi:hypothetical protein